MLFYHIASLILIGICHIYLYILCIRYHRMSYTLITVLSVLFTVLLAIAVTVTGYPELNFIISTLFLLTIGFMQKEVNLQQSLYFILFSMVVFTVLKLLLFQLSYQLFFVLPFNLYTWTENMLHFLVTLILLATIFLSRKKIEQFSHYIIRSKVYVPTYFLLILCTSLLFVLNYPSSAVLSYFHVKFSQESLVAVIVLFIVLMLLFLMSFHFSKTQLIEEHEQQLHRQLVDYVKKLEEMHDELAAFRHDYVNILLSLEDGIRTKNFEQIEHVYREIIAPTSQIINHHELEIIKLSRVAIPEIKSILSVKLLSAQQKKLQVSVDIPEVIDEQFFPAQPLIRIMSILLDNAIEEAYHTDEKQLQIALFKLNDCHYFIVRNSSSQPAIDLQRIYKKNQSTKSGDRGYGLFSLKRMVEQSHKVTLETSFDAPIFTQTLIFKK